MRPRTRRALLVSVEIAVPALVLAAWWVWSARSDSFYFSPLPDVVQSFRDTWLFERFGSDVVPSLTRLFSGYAIACITAVVLGVLLGRSPLMRRATSPLVEFFRAIPPTALLPFAILVFGVGFEMKVFIIAFVCIWPVLLNTIDGVRGMDSVLLETVRVYQISRFEQLRRVVLPAISPQIFAGMRTSLSLAVILMVVSEMVSSTDGIGYFILQAQRSFDIPEMWSGIILLGILGYALNAVFVWVERRSLTWYHAIRSTSS